MYSYLQTLTYNYGSISRNPSPKLLKPVPAGRVCEGVPNFCKFNWDISAISADQILTHRIHVCHIW